MRTLALDCSSPIMAVALETEAGVHSRIGMVGRRHAELLMPTIEALMAEAGLEAADLDLVVCGKGPGSFTGLRIAMASAKGIAAGSGRPLVSVPGPDWLAEPFRSFAGLVVPVLDARKGRLYAAVYSGGIRHGSYLDLSPADLAAHLGGATSVLFTGPDADLMLPMAADRDGWDIDRFWRSPRPECLVSLGKALYEERGPDSPAEGPLYLRESEEDMGIQLSARARKEGEPDCR